MQANLSRPHVAESFRVQKWAGNRRHLHPGADPAERRGGFAFAPGQFNMLYAFGVGEVPISISGDPARPGHPGAHGAGRGRCHPGHLPACPGRHLGVRGPFGAPWPVAEAAGQDVVIVAGGPGSGALAAGHLSFPEPSPGLRQLRADLRGPHPGGPALSPGTGALAGPLRPPGARHRGHRRGRLAGRRRGGDHRHSPGPLRPGQHHRPGVRPRGDDALHRAGTPEPGA